MGSHVATTAHHRRIVAESNPFHHAQTVELRPKLPCPPMVAARMRHNSLEVQSPGHTRLAGAPGTVDGGDICEAGDHFFIGLSERTNEEGVRQLAGHLERMGFTSETVDIRAVAGILHLKSAIAALSERRLVVIDALAAHPGFRGYELIRVDPAENYAANCIRVNDTVLVASGFPKFEASVRALGLTTIALDMSEFAKMDGGLSCLSLRF